MEVLVSKLAELLQVGVDGAAKAYPVLRGQYIWYKAMENIIVTSGIVFFVGLTVGIVISLVRSIEYGDTSDYNEISAKIYKTTGLVCVISLIIWVAAATFRVVLAPDIMMILEML